MICPACGAKNRQGARFCRTCGRPIDEEHEEAGQAAGAPDNEPRAAAPDEEPSVKAGSEGAPVEEAGTKQAPAEEPGAEPGGGDVPVEEGPGAAQAPEAAQAGEPETGPDVPNVPAEIEPPDKPGPAPTAEPPEAGGADAGAGDEEAEAGPEPAPEADVEAEVGDELSGFWREDQEPIEPASPGTLIADRYVVLEVLDAGTDQVLYRVRDLQQCWQCGTEIEAGEAFCPQCGAAQEQPPPSAAGVRLLEVRPPGDEAPRDVNAVSRLTHDERPFFVLAEPEAKTEPPPAAVAEPEGIRLVVGQRSDPGRVRELDEDSVLTIHVAPTYEAVTTVLGLFAVADGMGGHDGGEIASKLALQVLADHTLRTILLPELAGELRLDEDVLARLRQAVLAANDAVFLARQKRANDMGTTLTVVLVRNRRLLVAHVGDCRAYRWSDAGLEQVTTDHSVIASMIARGQVAPEEIYTHPHRSVIYRAIGDQPTVEVDGDVLPLEAGQRIVVCSDGLWEMVRSEGIADVLMQEANPQAACDLLVQRANAAGGEDNISVVIVQVEGA